PLEQHPGHGGVEPAVIVDVVGVPVRVAVGPAGRDVDPPAIVGAAFVAGRALFAHDVALRVRRRNSARVRGSSRTTPSRLEVVRLEPGVLTPRRVMQLCSASMTTPTPWGCSTS